MPDSLTPDRPSPNDQQQERKPLRVLLVEDSEDDALLIERQLRRGNYQPTMLRVDSADALDKALLEREWDIVITDHNLPNFDSHQALALVRKDHPDLPVIIVSGSIGEELAVEAMKSGANDYIMKDKLSRLVPAIGRELRDAELRRAHRQAEATIRHMAYHDALTGLVNRREFERRIQKVIDRGGHHALLYLDLDQFKVINDTCGHIAGDALLRALTVDLITHIRDRDTLARLGGDEFGILLENCPLERAQEIAEMVREAIHGFRFSWKQHNFVIGVSIGVVEIDETVTSVEEILSAADMACYAAKDLGRNRVHLYRRDDAELSLRHNEMQWASRISQSIEENRLCLYQHSIVPLDEHSNAHHREFLVRMVGPSGEIILPNAFIPAAERYNLMPGVDRWVIENVFRSLAASLGQRSATKEGTKPESICFINLSGTSLSDDGLHKFIRQLLHRYQLPPEMICFEITETAAITDFRNAMEFITQIKEEGCRFALDDFGTGMSSFSYIKRIPLDFIKIDGGFVKNLVNDPMDCAIVEAITRIAHVGGMSTIAEFVQDEACKTLLRQIGVDFAQGYGIDRPKAVKAGESFT